MGLNYLKRQLTLCWDSSVIPINDGFDPIFELCDPGIDARVVRLGTAITPADDTNQVVLPSGVVPMCHHRAAAVTLAIEEGIDYCLLKTDTEM